MAAVEQQTALRNVIQGERERLNIPGIAWGTLSDGEMTMDAVGVAKLSTGESLRADALFRIASISKVFTATLAMTLVDEGKLDLNAPVSQYLPGVTITEAGIEDRISMRHLLSHGSGMFGDYGVNQGLGEDAIAKAIAEFGGLRLYSEPDELWFYCNAGFHLAGRIIEVVAEQPFEQVMRERVFEGLGLERTCFWAWEQISWPHAVGHNQVAPGNPEHVVADQYYPRNRIPAGGVISNVPDLLRFAQFHMGDGTVDGRRVLSEESLRAMREPQRKAGNWADAWGIGWDIRTIDGVQIISHGGSIAGKRLHLTLVPERDWAFVSLTNSSRGSAANRVIERAALEHVLGLRAPRPEPVTLSVDDLTRFAGHYRNDDVQVDISVADGGLVLHIVGPGPNGGDPVSYPDETLVPVAEREFLHTDGDSAGERLDFIVNTDGTPRYLRMHGRLYDPR